MLYQLEIILLKKFVNISKKKKNFLFYQSFQFDVLRFFFSLLICATCELILTACNQNLYKNVVSYFDGSILVLL